MKDKKTVVVNYLGRRGGGPVYAYEMTRGLINNGYEVIAFISDRVENLESWKLLSPVTLEVIETFDSAKDYVPASIRFTTKVLPTLGKKYGKKHVDAVYMPMQHPWMNKITGLFPGAKTIYTLHDPKEHTTNNSIFEKTKSAISGVRVSDMDEVVILSECFRDYVKTGYGLKEDQIHVIPHGIFDFYSKVDDGSIYEYPVDKTTFLFFGRIDAYKGLDVLAEAYGILKKKRDDIALTIAGSGSFEPYRRQYEELTDVTVINEWIPDGKVASFFKGRNVILVAPYTDATQSGVIPIAMSHGIPVIASDAGGLKEQVEDGVTGYLFSSGAAVSLAECMNRALESDDSVITANAAQFIKTLDWDSLSRKLGEII